MSDVSIAELMVKLGCSTDLFCDALTRASTEVVTEAIALLDQRSPPNTPAWILERAGFGVETMQAELERRKLS